MNNLIELHFYLEDLFPGLEAVSSPRSQEHMNPVSLSPLLWMYIMKDVHNLISLMELHQKTDQEGKSLESKMYSELKGILIENLLPCSSAWF